jgi:HSP20 family protein
MSMLSRWDPFTQFFEDMTRWQQGFNRLLSRMGNGWPLRSEAAVIFPAVNIWEDQDHVWAEAELPGLKMDDLEIYVTGHDQLTIKGERQPFKLEQGVWHRQERGYGTFTRVLQLPVAVDPNQIEARLENGVLTIRMAKSEAAKPRKITVKAE